MPYCWFSQNAAPCVFMNIFQYSTVLSKMEGIYSKAKVCGIPPDTEKCYSLEPGKFTKREILYVLYKYACAQEVQRGEHESLKFTGQENIDMMKMENKKQI